MALKKFLKIFYRVILSLLLLVLVLWVIMQTPWGQNWLGRQVTSRLSKELQTRISIEKVDFSFFNKMNLQGVLVEDQHQDTLLYAGKLQVRITDWFFFRDRADLKYIGLDDAVINFHRSDSVWNYQFIADYFAPAPGQEPKKKAGIVFDIKEAAFRNVLFNKVDAWKGEDMYVQVQELDMTANELTLSGKNIDINRLALVQPLVRLKSYDGYRPERIAQLSADDPEKIDSILQWNSSGLGLRVGLLTISNGRFMTDKNDGMPLSHFDGQHIDFSKIYGSFSDVHWESDTIKTNVDLKAEERSGLIVRSLKAEMKFHPEAMEFEQLDLHTNNSVIRDYFAMRYDKFSDMSEFISKVRMRVNFADARIDSDDIAFFAPDISDWNKSINISGLARGTVQDINADNLTVEAGNNTWLSGDLTLSGLPAINRTFIDFRANGMRTTYADAVLFLPRLRQVETPNLASIRSLEFQGNFTGFLRDFVTYGTITTNLGTIRSDLNMKLPEGGSPIYSGNLATSGFELGNFLGNEKIGAIAMDATLRGQGFSMQTIDAQVDGTIQSLGYNGYVYHDMEMNGRLQQQRFDGYFAINDSNAVLTMNGVVDLSGDQPRFDLVANVQKARLQQLNLTRDNLQFAGKLGLNFSGSHIDDFLGSARLFDASLTKDDTRLSFDSLVVHSSYETGIKTLSIRSNEIDAVVRGEFDVESLPAAFKYFLHRYYPENIPAPVNDIGNQAFSFDITTRNIDPYIPLIIPELNGFQNSHLTGSLHTLDNKMELHAEVPYFSYQQYAFSDAVIDANGDVERMVLTGDLGNVQISDSLQLPRTSLRLESSNGISDITVNTSATQAINNASLAARVETFSDGLKIIFQPSNFVLNGKTWSIQQGGELEFRRNSVTQGELLLSESNQQIRLKTVPSGIGNWNDVEVSLEQVNLGDITPLFLKNNRLEGLASGEIYIEDPQRNLVATGDIEARQLRLDDDSIGNARTTVIYNHRTGELKAVGGTLDEEHKLAFNVDINVKDTTDAYDNKISITPTNYPISILSRFIGNLFSDMQGYLTGNLDILGLGENQRFIGKGRLRNAGLRINFTQVFYRILDTEIELTEDAIELGTLKLVDTLTGNTATVRGSIMHTGFSDMFYDIFARVDDEPITLLNTSLHDNQAFYGFARGTGSFSLTGPQANMYMDIVARASETDSSYIILPPSQSRESGLADFMVERKFGREMNPEDLRGNATGITYDVNLTANPMVNMKVILDELTGDVIEGKGDGVLFISGGSNEPLSIRGRYNLQEGKYDYTFQSLFQRPFELRPSEANYIEWSGDPYDAIIQLNAIYVANDVSFSPLSQLPGLSSRIANYRGDVHVIARLTGDLFKPNFNFSLEFPDKNLTNDPGFDFNIRQIQSNPDEINKQVTYLIVLNSFAPIENAAFTPGIFNEFAYNTLSGLLFGEMNKRLNQLLSGILQNNDLTLNFSGSLYNRNLIDQTGAGGFAINQSNFSLILGKSFFNDRFTISFGSTLDVPLQSSISQTIQFLPDVTLEWRINQSGSIRATFFYRENLDLLAGATNSSNPRTTKRTGGSISYRKEFNSFGALFKKKAASDSTVTDTTGQRLPEEQ